MIHRARIQKLDVVTKYDKETGTRTTKAQAWVTIPRLAGDKYTYGPCEMADGLFLGRHWTAETVVYGTGGWHTHYGEGDQWTDHQHGPHQHVISRELVVGDWVWVGFEGGAFDSPVVLARAVHD